MCRLMLEEPIFPTNSTKFSQYNAVKSVENQSTFRRNMSLCLLLHAGFLLALFFDPEYGGYMFLRNVGCI
jgi:hypothetical protein